MHARKNHYCIEHVLASCKVKIRLAILSETVEVHTAAQIPFVRLAEFTGKPVK